MDDDKGLDPMIREASRVEPGGGKPGRRDPAFAILLALALLLFIAPFVAAAMFDPLGDLLFGFAGGGIWP